MKVYINNGHQKVKILEWSYLKTVASPEIRTNQIWPRNKKNKMSEKKQNSNDTRIQAQKVDNE